MGKEKFVVGCYDPEYLLKRYEPLINALNKKYLSKYWHLLDPQELRAQTEFEFLKLLKKYDPKRGVDFDFFIKKMLNFSVLHYVERLTKINKNEGTADGEETVEKLSAVVFPDFITKLPLDLVLTDYQRELLIAVVVHDKKVPIIARDCELGVEDIIEDLEDLAEMIYSNMSIN